MEKSSRFYLGCLLPMPLWKIALIVGLGFWVPAGVYGMKQYREEQTLDRYLAQLEIVSGMSAWKYAVALSQKIREEFEVDEKKYRVMNMENRPFLREDTQFLLTHKEGQCGEGTRVLVNLLNKVGYNATRITLYDANLDASHTLISLVDGDAEYLVDSINSPVDINHFINTHQLNASHFSLVKYDGNVSKRDEASYRLRNKNKNKVFSSDTKARFHNQFLYYSYESIPYTKLLNALGLDMRVMNFARPPIFLSVLSEKPHLIRSILFLVLSIVTAVGICCIGLLWQLAKALFCLRGIPRLNDPNGDGFLFRDKTEQPEYSRAV